MINICNTTWPELRHLDICMCEIGDKSFEYINITNFPKLSILLALRDNLTIQGL